jgi:hypothetical protein
MIVWTGDQLINLHKIKLQSVYGADFKPRSQYLDINLDLSFEQFYKEKAICYTARHFEGRGGLSLVHPL